MEMIIAKIVVCSILLLGVLVALAYQGPPPSEKCFYPTEQADE